MLTQNHLFLIVGLFTLQGLVLFLCFSRWAIDFIHSTRLRQVALFFCTQALCLCLVLIGAYAEERWVFFDILRGSADKLLREGSLSPPERYAIKGDPGLIQWVQEPRTSLPRPDFTSAETLRAWQTQLQRTMRELFELSDIALPVKVRSHKLSSTVVADNITRFFLSFESFDGTSIPAYLFLPPLAGPQPAILVLSGHVQYGEEGITQTAGIVESYQHGAALALARAGYITLTMEFRGFGYLGARVNAEHRLVAHNAILGGSFYKAVLSKDIKYALDFLLSVAEVDPRRIGITGVSFGGEMAVTYAALDERIKVVVFQGFGGGVGQGKGTAGSSQKEQPHYCHIIPHFNKYFHQEDFFFLIAPRPLLGIRGERHPSGNPPHQAATLGQAHAALNAFSLFKFEVAPGGHEYFVQPAIQFFQRHL
jgi:dienelactone hydrolase